MKIKKILLALLILCGVGVLGVVGVFVYYCWDLPQITSLKDYHPKEPSYLYSDDGEVMAVFSARESSQQDGRTDEQHFERRTEVSVADLPPHVINAFLAAEDASFYEHHGINYLALMRAVVKNILGSRQGASTITQQTVKTMVLGPEQSIRRKIREAVLTKRLEDMLNKDEILHLYLNQIYFGNGVYGVEEASRLYFNCSVKDLTIKEAALLASIPKNPGRYNVLSDVEGTQYRHKWILGQMVANGFITQEQATAAEKDKIRHPGKLSGGNYPLLRDEPTGGYYVETARRILEEKVGVEKLYEGGLKIYTVMDSKYQRYAETAFREGMEKQARAQGWKGPISRVEIDQYDTALKNLHAGFATHLARWTAFYLPPPEREGKPVWDLSKMALGDFDSESACRSKMILRSLQVGGNYVGIVSGVDTAAKAAQVDLGGAIGTIPFKGLEWTGRKNITQVLAKGDIIKVRVVRHGFSKKQPQAFDLKESLVPGTVAPLTTTEELVLELVPWPKLDGALISMEPQRGWVKAMVGGYDQYGTGFNRATQAKRQPGSTFKPIVYTTGIRERVITPATMCQDAPVLIRDEWTGKEWRPHNSDGKYDGNIRYRMALAKSKNVCSVKMVDQLDSELDQEHKKRAAQKVIGVARLMGITSALPENLTIALGAGEITPLELVTAYSTLAGGGMRPKAIFVRKVLDRERNTLWEDKVELEEVLEPAVAYVVTSMMQSVVQEGTAKAALSLGRELAGKTGTTNNARSIWFGGFTPDLATVIYNGYDNNKSLGRASGSSGPLPIFIKYMEPIVAQTPEHKFERPEGVEVANIDPASGLLAQAGNERWLEEVFLSGTAPTEYASDAGGDIYSSDEIDDSLDSSGNLLEEDEEVLEEKPYYDEPVQ